MMKNNKSAWFIKVIRNCVILLILAGFYFYVLESRYGPFMYFKPRLFFLIFIVLLLSGLVHKRKKGNKSLKDYILYRLAGASGSTRVPFLDTLRVIAMVLVILAHVISYGMESVPPEAETTAIALRIAKSLTVWCNSLFVMLSGAVVLYLGGKGFKSVGAFYEKRFLRVLIPCFVYYLFYIYYAEGTTPFLPDNIPQLIRGFLNNDSGYVPHFWLMFVILSCYLSAPVFLLITKASSGNSNQSAGENIMSDKILDGIAFAIILSHVVFTYSPLFSVNLPMESFFAGWESIFLLGYYFMTDAAMKHYRFFTGAGILSIIILFTVTLYEPVPDYPQYLYNLAPPMLFLSGAAFLFFRKNEIRIRSKKAKIREREPFLIKILSQNSFSILLFHWIVLFDFVGNRLNIISIGYYTLPGIILSTLLTIIFSLFFAVMLDNTLLILADELVHFIISFVPYMLKLRTCKK